MHNSLSQILYSKAEPWDKKMTVSIAQSLREKQNGSMRADFFFDLLDEHFPHQEAERQFSTAVDWGRYAELFEYDASEERLYLPEVREQGTVKREQ